jgi:tripartite-type tricarboxylate transporter receptor subunit TctC
MFDLAADAPPQVRAGSVKVYAVMDMRRMATDLRAGP